MEFTALFWYKLVFITEIIVSEGLFVSRLRLKNRFLLRLLIALILIYGLTFFFPIPAFNAVYVSFMFFILFGLTVVGVKFCTAESWWNVLFCCIASYTVQHIAYVLYYTLDDIIGLFGIFQGSGVLNPYAAELSEVVISPVTAVIYFDAYFLVYYFSYYILARRIKRHADLKLGKTGFVAISGIIILVDIIFNAITIYNADGNAVSLYLEHTYNLLTCLLALGIQFSSLYQKEMKHELDSVNEMLRLQAKQYEITRKTIDTINIKCHDMKHQIKALRKRGSIPDASELEEIEHVIDIYDCSVKTGNEALDVVFTEKKLQCEREGINITCMADGKLLGFMRPADIYALFGNALDNAMEAVNKLDKSKRNISFSVRGVGNITVIRVENSFEGEIKLIDGMPGTSKENKAFHGFGVLSIKTIAEKYGGEMAIELVKGQFCLNVILPVPKTE